MAKKSKKVKKPRKEKREQNSAEKNALFLRMLEYETIFVNGKHIHVQREPAIEGPSVDEFIRRNADPTYLHQLGLCHIMEEPFDEESDALEFLKMELIGKDTFLPF